MRLLGRYQGRNGAIEIIKCSADGTRIYFKEGVRQSQATPDGESVFSYVKLMDELLHRATNVLVLGCGGGNLATRLARLGKELTIVDNNPISFVIAQRYFGLPDGSAAGWCQISGNSFSTTICFTMGSPSMSEVRTFL